MTAERRAVMGVRVSIARGHMMARGDESPAFACTHHRPLSATFGLLIVSGVSACSPVIVSAFPHTHLFAHTGMHGPQP